MNQVKLSLSCLLLALSFSQSLHAASWVKLSENKIATVQLNKQSIVNQDKYIKAWVKIDYKVNQKNLEGVEKEYNLSKLLWFFDCSMQKATTAQVLQYMNDTLVYSVAIDTNQAEFIEPAPETEVDIAMRYVCKASINLLNKAKDNKKTNKKIDSNAEPDKAKEAIEDNAAVKAINQSAEKTSEKPSLLSNTWGYEGKVGPDYWAKLSPDYIACGTGRNQSPINIQVAIHAPMLPLKMSQHFPAKDILVGVNNISVNFTKGNMMVLDGVPFQLKQMLIHTPSENQINGKSFPLEVHFVHADSKENLTILAVMFKEGDVSPALDKLLTEAKQEGNKLTPLKTRVTPDDFIPKLPQFYRFSGSLTTPPCTEGVNWIVMKSPMAASKVQIDTLKKILLQHNNRPIQALNGRMVID